MEDESGNSSVKDEVQVTVLEPQNSSEYLAALKPQNSSEPQKSSERQNSSEPRPQRRLRLNRRTFTLSTIQNDVKPLSEIKSSRKIHLHSKGTDSAKSDLEVSSNKKVPVISEKRKIISLSSAKNGFSDKDESDLTQCIDLDSHDDESSKTGTLRSVHVGGKNVTVNVESSCSQDSQEDPPKKKHKPITWP